MYNYFLILLISVFCVSCGKKTPPGTPPGETQPTVPQEVTEIDPLEFEMIVHDEGNVSDGEELGGEKFFVVQQKLSNGKIALFVADNHTYDSFVPDVLLNWLGGDTLADKAQARIKKILKDHGGALRARVCGEDSVQDRRSTLIKEGLTKGTLVIVSGNTWTTYMEDTLSDGFFDGFQVSSVERGSEGLLEQMWLSRFDRFSSTTIEAGSDVNQSRSTEDRYDITLLFSPNASIKKSLIDLNQYIGILDNIRGADDQFSSCHQ